MFHISFAYNPGLRDTFYPNKLMLELQGEFLITASWRIYFVKMKNKHTVYLPTLQHIHQCNRAACFPPSNISRDRLPWQGHAGTLSVIKSFSAGQTKCLSANYHRLSLIHSSPSLPCRVAVRYSAGCSGVNWTSFPLKLLAFSKCHCTAAAGFNQVFPEDEPPLHYPASSVFYSNWSIMCSML